MRLAIFLFLCCAAAAQINPVAITIHADLPSVTIPADFLGLSFETGSLISASGFPAENTQFQRMIWQLGPGWLRFGGNSVDKTAWVPGGAAGNLTPAAVDRVMALARATGWRVLWSLGLANATAATDANEADYVISSASDVLAGLEIGNEPDLFAKNGYIPSTLADYLTAWGQYADSIQALHAQALLTGPAASGSISTWTSAFGAMYGPRISLLTQHYYPLSPVAGASNQATIANILSSTTHGAAQSTGLAVNTVAQKAKAPWRMAETNSCYNGGQAGVSDVFASALWGIDYMFTLAGTSAAGVNFHGGGSGAYTPIAASGSAITARPLYYAMLLFGAAARGRLVPVNVNAGRINLTSFGVLDADGSLRVVVINKDQALDAAAQITPAGGSGYDNATVMRLSAPSLLEKNAITLGGSSVAADGSWSPSAYERVSSKFGFFNVDVPAGSAVVLGFGSQKLGIGSTAGGGAVVAPNSMASIYGQNLGFVSRSTPSIDLPETLAAVSATVTDSSGTTRAAPLIYVSPYQINLLVPPGTAPGPATVAVGVSTGTVQVANVTPGLFTEGGKVAAATAQRYPSDGSAAAAVAVFDCSSGACVATPIALDAQSTVYVSLYGTGLRAARNVTCTVGGVTVPVQFAAQGQYPGLDQANIQLPLSLQGMGAVDIVLTADGQTANTVQIAIQ